MSVTAVQGSNNSIWCQKTNGSLGKEAFFQLLAAQLQYQNPLQPLEDREFIAQLAQFSTLEQLANLNASFQEMFLTQALGFVGLEIKAEVDGTAVGGTVTGLRLLEGIPYLLVGEEVVPIWALTEVRQPPVEKAAPAG